MKERPKALIVGARPTGLVMAHELARDGIQCRLIDLFEAAECGPLFRPCACCAATCQAHRAEARGLLAAVYDRFTEGFDTQDLKGAKAALDELG
jgi:2-polyprenyl-6-methoxyphenol hydroxylase-like FAD-dependent oxidoreductase